MFSHLAWVAWRGWMARVGPLTLQGSEMLVTFQDTYDMCMCISIYIHIYIYANHIYIIVHQFERVSRDPNDTAIVPSGNLTWLLKMAHLYLIYLL